MEHSQQFILSSLLFSLYFYAKFNHLIMQEHAFGSNYPLYLL